MTVALFIYKNIYCRYLCPGECIICDQGSEFKNKVFESLAKDFNVDLRFCSPGHPMSNGLAEANVKTIKNKSKAFMSETSNIMFFFNFYKKI